MRTKDLAAQEWFRLSELATSFESRFRIAWNQTVTQRDVSGEILRDAVIEAVAETATSTARIYDMDFNPGSNVYRGLINYLTDNYMRLVKNDEAKDKVRQLLSSNGALGSNNRRYDLFGIDANAVVRLDNLRGQGASSEILRETRRGLSLQRGNLVAVTEANRITNATVEAVWIDNLLVKKASTGGGWYVQDGPKAYKIDDLSGISGPARKEIVTRKDSRTCDYCAPLDRVTAPLAMNFDTRYGMFPYPPFHPRCRCVMIVRM